MKSPRPSDKPNEPILLSDAVITLRCACCGLPFARLEEDKLVVASRYKGVMQVNEMSVEALGTRNNTKAS